MPTAATLAPRRPRKATVPSPMKAEAITRAGLLFDVARDLTRLNILLHLARVGEANVTELTAHLGMSQPAVSHHAKLLLISGAAESRREGWWRFYSLTPAGRVLAETAARLGEEG